LTFPGGYSQRLGAVGADETATLPLVAAAVDNSQVVGVVRPATGQRHDVVYRWTVAADGRDGDDLAAEVAPSVIAGVQLGHADAQPA
jgi:hypothetical protein